MSDRTWRTTFWWRRLLLRFFAMFSFIKNSGDEFNFSSSVSSFYSCTLRASGPKRSLPPTDMTSGRSLSLWGRSTVGDSKMERRRSLWRWVKSSVEVTPESWAMICASRAIELALWMRSSTNVMSFWILFLVAESWMNLGTFWRKL